MKLQIYKHWDIATTDDRNIKYWYIDIKKEYCNMWYEEIMLRHKICYLNDKLEKVTYDEFQKVFPIYDVDEAHECWWMSIDHLIDLLNFLKNK